MLGGKGKMQCGNRQEYLKLQSRAKQNAGAILRYYCAKEFCLYNSNDGSHLAICI